MIRKKINSPFTGGVAYLQRAWTEEVFRRESFKVCKHFYRCEDTKNEFSITALDEFNVQQVYNQYRAQHYIPFPAEIRKIREGYGLSAAKMSDVLDFGVNSYRQYEQGEIPSLANAKLIRLAKDPKNFKSFVEEKKNSFSANAYQKIREKIQDLLGLNEMEPLVKYIWNQHINPNEFTGYINPSLEKVANYIIFFAREANPLKTRMNKLMFYSDFLNYKRSGYSISGCNYRAIQMGPVPSHFRELFGILESKGYINIEDEIFDHGGIGERFFPRKEFNKHLFTSEELACMKYTVKAFTKTRTKQIIQLSHEEPAWKANQEKRELISYQAFAFDLQALE